MIPLQAETNDVVIANAEINQVLLLFIIVLKHEFLPASTINARSAFASVATQNSRLTTSVRGGRLWDTANQIKIHGRCLNNLEDR